MTVVFPVQEAGHLSFHLQGVGSPYDLSFAGLRGEEEEGRVYPRRTEVRRREGAGSEWTVKKWAEEGRRCRHTTE